MFHLQREEERETKERRMERTAERTLEETKMDTGTKLEHVLRHLKNAEPTLENWMEFGDVGRSTEVFGVLLNSGALNNDLRHMVDGLVVAVYLLTKKCVALEKARADMAPQWNRECRGGGWRAIAEAGSSRLAQRGSS
jgi:hypothetical protein